MCYLHSEKKKKKEKRYSQQHLRSKWNNLICGFKTFLQFHFDLSYINWALYSQEATVKCVLSELAPLSASSCPVARGDTSHLEQGQHPIKQIKASSSGWHSLFPRPSICLIRMRLHLRAFFSSHMIFSYVLILTCMMLNTGKQTVREALER